MKAKNIPVGHLAISSQPPRCHVIRTADHIMFISDPDILWDCLPIKCSYDDYEDLGRVSEVMTSAGKTVTVGESLK